MVENARLIQGGKAWYAKDGLRELFMEAGLVDDPEASDGDDDENMEE